jgi:glycopeptide antibiotics resistance protein
MYTRFISTLLLVIYSTILIKVMVLREIPTIRIGHLMLRFGGADANGNANFVPFKTIASYLLGNKGLIIVGINIAGNIGLLVPFGILLPFVYRNITWKASLVIAVLAGVLIEGQQVVLHTGIFDIDDVILNALGVMIGYWICSVFKKVDLQ